jgi:hypothetical protein
MEMLGKIRGCTFAISCRHTDNQAHWVSVPGAAKMPTALLDWLTQHCHIGEPGNDSYPSQAISLAAQSRIKARLQKPRDGQGEPIGELF